MHIEIYTVAISLVVFYYVQASLLILSLAQDSCLSLTLSCFWFNFARDHEDGCTIRNSKVRGIYYLLP
jgi:hypothetical protein